MLEVPWRAEYYPLFSREQRLYPVAFIGFLAQRIDALLWLEAIEADLFQTVMIASSMKLGTSNRRVEHMLAYSHSRSYLPAAR